MKYFVLFSLLSFNLFAQSQDPRIIKDLNILLEHERGVGGAGNGGGDWALFISRQINKRAMSYDIDFRKFRKYTILAGSYNFCGVDQDCSLAAAYYKQQNAVLVNRTNWIALSPSEKGVLIDELIKEMIRE